MALNKGPVGPKFLEPTPFLDKLKKAYMSDIIEYANKIPLLGKPYLFYQSVLSNKFDGNYISLTFYRENPYSSARCIPV